ncbi:MAG: cytochrome c maturation protein CcmE [Fidelibacterota bacterium]|nr:MAG: cytochrome c maturation protein CcmE [Candidatus Neomarinimicrobiota bacterium]
MKSQRSKFVILIAAVALIVFGWLTIGTEEEEVPYVSIAELHENPNRWEQRRLRLGGLVEAGSIVYSADKLSVDFVMVQGDDVLPVHYSGLTPDLFQDSVEVIIEGEFRDDVFAADNLMTKCASRYEVDAGAPGTDPGTNN